MSRRKTAHPLIDQAAEQAAALVDTVTPHVEAARDRLLDDYVPQARAALEDARDTAEQAISAAASKAATKAGRKPEKHRGRTVLRLAALAGVGIAIGQWLRNRNVSPASMYEAPAPAPAQKPPVVVDDPKPDPEDLHRLEDEAPLNAPEPPEDSLNSFFDEITSETSKGSRGR